MSNPPHCHCPHCPPAIVPVPVSCTLSAGCTRPEREQWRACTGSLPCGEALGQYVQPMRIAAQTLVEIVIAVLLTLLFVGALNTIDNTDPAGAFFRDAPGLVFSAFWIGLTLWVVLVIIGNVVHRNRRPSARIAHNLVSALVASILNTVVFATIGFTAGGWGLLIVALAIVPGLAFLLAAGIAVPLTHRVLVRSGVPAATESSTPVPPAPTHAA
jgi:hypothetical protein